MDNFYECHDCAYISYDLAECRKHYCETKHMMRKITATSFHNLYYCEECSYVCNKHSDYQKHLATGKHVNPTKNKEHVCTICNKTYETVSGLWKHSRKCNSSSSKQQTPTKSMEFIITQLLKDNQDFKQLIIDQNKQLFELANKTTSTTNNTTNITNNNGFNLNMFLNSTCKDAVNMSDFINMLTVSMEDLERTGKLGYIEGITGIIVRKLRELDVLKRPIHCNDFKRETVYVKDNDKWEKELKNKPKLLSAIQSVSNKNIRQLHKWKKDNPDCIEPTSIKNDDYLYMVKHSMGGATEEEEDKNIQKVMKNIIKEVIIDKDNVPE
jgi:hypothetical protein